MHNVNIRMILILIKYCLTIITIITCQTNTIAQNYKLEI